MQKDIFFEKCFEHHSFQFLNNIDVNMLTSVLQYHFKLYPLTPESIFFDVGTNAGSFIKVLQKFNIYNNIHCFEPHPVISKYTYEKYNYIIMNKMCLCDKDGEIDVNFHVHAVGLSSIINRPIFTNRKNIKTIKSQCQKLDTYCKNNHIDKIDFIKIDVEGAEKMVFEGSNEMLKNNKIKAGVFEIGETLTDAGTSGLEIEKLLKNYGYTVIKNLSKNDWYFHLKNN